MTDTTVRNEAHELLKQVRHALNKITNQRFTAENGRVTSTYDLVSRIEYFLRSRDPKQDSIVDYCWEDLHCYKYNPYPNTLIVTTPATPDQVKQVYDKFQAMENTVSFAEFITKETGLPAITGCIVHELDFE